MGNDAKQILVIRIIRFFLLNGGLAAGLVLCAWLYGLLDHTPIFAAENGSNVALIIILIICCLGLGLIVSLWSFLTERKRFLTELSQIKSVDSLTGLLNNKGFEAQAQKILSVSPEGQRHVIVLFEVVSFRSYNELYGFEAGDALIKTIAAIAKKYAKKGDVLARAYSHHFVWLASGENEEEIFNTLKDTLKEVKGTGLPFYLCGGLFLIDDRKMPVSDMIDRAAIARDTIKKHYGMGLAVFDNSMLERQLPDTKLVGNIVQGLQNGEFIDYYQPKYNTDTEEIVGAEVLVRWRKPDGEIIAPNQFISLFEKSGYIRKLDFYLFETACAFLSEATKNKKPILPVSVNFSRVHMHEELFPQKLFDLTQKYGLSPQNFEIELTESVFDSDTKVTRKIVKKLQDFGFSVAIDDFGSGYSSLNMLKDFDFDTLKIDTKFLEGFECGGKVGTVITSVVRMAKWLGIPVVAEGVETRQQVDFLRTLGCEMIQGYYFSRPVPREEYEALLNKERSGRPKRDKAPELAMTGIDAVLGADSVVTSILDGILGGFGIYEFSGNSLEAIRVNHTYYELMGYPDSAAFSEHSLNIVKQVYAPDTKKLLNACRMAISSGKVQKLSARRYKYDGTLAQFDCLIKHIGGSAENALICMTFVDASERLSAERETELNKYCDALHGMFDEIFEFNYNKDALSLLSRERKKIQNKVRNLGTAEKNWLENIVHPDDREKLEELVALARANEIELPFTAEYRVIKDGQTRNISAYMVEITGGSYLLCCREIN